MSALDAFRLDGKVAIVTGAGRGIGASIARTFAEAGANIVLTARTKEQLDEVAADVRAAGREALVIPADVNDTDVMQEIVDRTVAELGGIDIVVNNAGGTQPRPFLDTSPGFFERSFHFNVTTAFVLSKAATPHLLASGAGSIVNISSAIGRLRDRGFVAYGTAKAALSHMTRLTAADLAPKVRVNAIAVGSIATRWSGAPRSNGSASPRTSRCARSTSRHRPAASSPASSSRSTADSKRRTSPSASPTSPNPAPTKQLVSWWVSRRAGRGLRRAGRNRFRRGPREPRR